MSHFPDGAALIYGGSGGMGSAIARRLAQDGVDCAICYRSNRDKAEQVAGEVEALGVKTSLHAVNIADKAQIAQSFADAVAAHGRVHTVMVTAGSDIEQPLLSEVTEAQWLEVVNADLNGFFYITQAALPHMKEKGGGSFVHMSSAGILRIPPRDVLSVAPKSAVEALIKYIAKEEGVNKIRANSVALGVIDAGIFHRLKEKGVFDKAWEEAVLSGLALKKFGRAEDVAEAAVYLASERAGYVTGQMIAVDGGYGI